MPLTPDDLSFVPIALRRDLVALGWSDAALARACRSGMFVRARRGAYVEGSVWAGMTDTQRFAVRSRAALLQAKTGVVLSHASALPFLDAPTWGVDLSEVHLTRQDERTGRREADVRQHRGRLADADVVVTHGVPHTSALRATLEVAVTSSVETGLVVANHFLHAGDFTPGQLRERYSQGIEYWPHSLTTDLVIRLADPRIESVGESRLQYLMWSQHLPKPVPQLEVHDARGNLVARLDFALPDQGVWLEFDGLEKYLRHRRAGESVVDTVMRQKRREEMITELTGMRCVRVIWADLAEPHRLAARITEVIRLVAASRQSPA